jgi:hypothetical protein
MGWLALVVAASGCAPWPPGTPLDPRTGGLIGEWAMPDPENTADTIVWRFNPDGTFESLRIRAPQASAGPHLTQLARGSWQVRESAAGDHRKLVCLGGHGTRQWPSCRFYQIQAVPGPSGTGVRHLTWEGWVGEKRLTTQTLIERS